MYIVVLFIFKCFMVITKINIKHRIPINKYYNKYKNRQYNLLTKQYVQYIYLRYLIKYKHND